MSDDATKAVCFHRWQLAQQVLNHGARDGDEGIAIVEAERREFVALAADVQSLAQSQLAWTGGFPKFLRGLVTVGSGFVESVLFLAKTSVDDDYCFPKASLATNAASFGLGSLAAKTRLDFAQRRNTFAFEMTAPGFGE